MSARRRWLRAGDRFRMHPDCGDSAEWEVIAVTVCSAKVRRLSSRYTAFETYKGESVEFEAPDRAVHISPTASVVLV